MRTDDDNDENDNDNDNNDDGHHGGNDDGDGNDQSKTTTQPPINNSTTTATNNNNNNANNNIIMIVRSDDDNDDCSKDPIRGNPRVQVVCVREVFETPPPLSQPASLAMAMKPHLPRKGRFGPCDHCGFAIALSHRMRCACVAAFYCDPCARRGIGRCTGCFARIGDGCLRWTILCVRSRWKYRCWCSILCGRSE